MHRHPNIAAWQREEDGSYKSELEGYSLHVVWRPESKDARRGFRWKLEGPGEIKREADEIHEEIEMAMAEAEDAAQRAASGLS
jgi:hypothetical protein